MKFYLKNYPKAVAKVNQLIDMIGESKFTIEKETTNILILQT